ncbi:unnamed protein product [Ambrosiozyma monospora]|uniref:Unnamed protein product n=1 Tax=Ambrosiozyma monospora TaxID=43982 RepID=A0ACB5TCP7_AMBMO|nr:unnamed protein product [Ambrosiozyma monospora]
MIHDTKLITYTNKPQLDCYFNPILHSIYTAGKPEGILTTLDGQNLYKTGNGSGDKILVILTDIFGHEYINTQLVADELAQSTGYLVLVPDILKGDPATFGDPNLRTHWLPKHTPEITTPIVDKFLSSVKSKYNPSYLVGIGYCFGGKWVIKNLAKDGAFDAGAVAHPSFVEIEEVEAVTKPLLISAAEIDQIFTTELRGKTDEILKKNGQSYRIDYFPGTSHGFAVRGELSDPVVGKAKNKVIVDQVAWFEKYSP